MPRCNICIIAGDVRAGVSMYMIIAIVMAIINIINNIIITIITIIIIIIIINNNKRVSLRGVHATHPMDIKRAAAKQHHHNNLIFVSKSAFVYGGHTTHHLLSRKRTCIPTAVVVTASSSATRLPPLCTVVLDCSVRNHLHRHCYHRHHRHQRQSKFIECGHTAHHARLRRRTSESVKNALTPFASCTR